jgi:hypothetical protein
LTRAPVRASGLARAYGLPLYTDFEEAKTDGLDAVYICSASASHAEDAQQAILAGFSKIWVEKPLVVTQAQWQAMQPHLSQLTAVMIKRHHRVLKDRPSVLYCFCSAMPKGAGEILRTGGPFLNELIHYIDAAGVLAGEGAVFSITGNRRCGEMMAEGRLGSVKICYDFVASEIRNDLAFYPDLMQSFFSNPAPALLGHNDVTKLYGTCFDLLSRLEGERHVQTVD